MQETDRLSLGRVSRGWEAWPGFVRTAGTWECLRKIHREIFGGLFTFAGKIRTVNISKGSFRFANAIFLEKILPMISEMPQENFADIIAKYTEMNIAHPFREGNGRAMRLWLDAMLEREMNTRIDWRKITREEYMPAMQRSPVNTLELETLLKGAMLKGDDLRNGVIFTEGVAVSYSYESV
ncbi:MAG: Fic family protein [Synergistaceae bacterium]|nr:Fic family protein [Synergistaceae bacterium]